MSNPHSTRRRALRVAFFAARAVVASAVLAATTVFVSPFAALALVAGFLWVALLMVARALRRERILTARLADELRERYNSIIGVLCGALDLKDDLGSMHTARVSELATIVAQEMGLRREEIRLLHKAAVLADIGKIEIAENILTKPGELSDEEWKQMKRHPELGYGILSEFPHLRDCGDIVLAHHERYDGQGYPRGLKGDEIPIGARILLVVDSYTAMTSDRPHRKKMSHDMAVKEILRNSLTQFDPEVVRAFVRCEERGQIAPGETTQNTRDQLEKSQPTVTTVNTASAA